MVTDSVSKVAIWQVLNMLDKREARELLKIENGYKKRLSCYLGALKEEEIGLEITGVRFSEED